MDYVDRPLNLLEWTFINKVIALIVCAGHDYIIYDDSYLGRLAIELKKEMTKNGTFKSMDKVERDTINVLLLPRITGNHTRFIKGIYEFLKSYCHDFAIVNNHKAFMIDMKKEEARTIAMEESTLKMDRYKFIDAANQAIGTVLESNSHNWPLPFGKRLELFSPEKEKINQI